MSGSSEIELAASTRQVADVQIFSLTGEIKNQINVVSAAMTVKDAPSLVNFWTMVEHLDNCAYELGP